MKRVLMLGMVAALSLGSAQQTKTVNLLWSGAITGPTSDVGGPYGAGVEDYCKYANEQKLIPSFTINCTVRDDQYQNPITQRIFEEALDRAKPAIYLGYSTGAMLQLKPLIQEVKMPTIPASAHIGLIEPPNNTYIFLPVSSYSEQIVALMEYIHRELKKNARIALVVNPSPFGRAVVDHAKRAAQRLGQTIVAVQEVGANNLDNTALLRNLDSQNVEFILHQNVAGPVANILKDAKRLGLDKKIRQMGAVYTGGSDLIRLAGDAAEGYLWASSYYTLDENVPGITLQKQLAQKYGRSTDILGSTNYTAGMLAAAIAVEAMKRAAQRFNGRIDNETVYQAIIGMNGPNAFKPGFAVSTKSGIEIDFTKSEQTGAEGLRVLEAKGGKFVPITEPFTSALFRQVRNP
ncbi:branched chain amino acid ABC transporter amino acid-binding protein [Allomeiothermus silvanus DSM 9946]|uniref:Branched chain amino acid ABC transporter amino acid-binding protein n=1 Tax=Allomeiothermus silvanus (strain ATCC 700542 / DSM 9946 / NBRC 106475 / NCIMB 13440 / VI-R2) TaxID=526227 RepID=D7BF83_ALLS1|nr:ABC transporter substrate-binding protein [Allomeiothermus silvanus]ADH63436.1 branched chain amino acid ABC transporter amino acid-binding protein [Allomeiothermus silvanus DSM 9946]